MPWCRTTGQPKDVLLGPAGLYEALLKAHAVVRASE